MAVIAVFWALENWGVDNDVDELEGHDDRVTLGTECARHKSNRFHLEQFRHYIPAQLPEFCL